VLCCFNPWYVDLISGLGLYENQLPPGWLIVELLSLFMVKNSYWSYSQPWFVAFSIPLCYNSWPSHQLW
jgi:hypothetical protein